MNVKITNDTYWAGKIDDRRVPFHRLILERGTTYNSYLLMTGKPTVIDTVDMAFGKEYVDNLKELIDPERIEYIVINHIEPDHAGALPALAAKARNAKIVTTELGSRLLKDMFKLHNGSFVVVKDGDILDIGGKTLKFLETPWLHTEETMITYAVEDKTLFSCDIFSTHIANSELFNDLAGGEYVEDFKVYYKLIMSPHRQYVRNMLEKVKNLQIDMIVPSHGYILRKDAASFIKMYDQMSRTQGKAEPKKVTIVYSTMTGNTAKLAQRLAKGLADMGIETSVFNMKNAEPAQVVERINESSGVLFGSSTKYADMVGNVEEVLQALQKVNADGKFAAAFGSYGWSGEAVVHMEDYLEKSGFTVINSKYSILNMGVDESLFPLRVKFDNEKGLDKAEEAGKLFGEQIISH